MKMNMREIRTKRLLLRPFRESDYDDLFEFRDIRQKGINISFTRIPEKTE